MGVKAYILITVETALTKEVLARLHDLSEPVEIHEVLGPYDIVVELETERFEDVTSVLREKIRPLPGVRNTVTCVDVQNEK
jgi:DNA-binding Lrp family transcriptional regulator